jgi:oleate hydratase
MAKTSQKTDGTTDGNVATKKAYLIGSGIASLASAAYLIRDGGVPGSNIVLFEESDQTGGSLDATGSPETGYTMRGGRMFEEAFNCTYDLLATIPSLSDPSKTVKEEIFTFHEQFAWHDEARLIDESGRRMDAHALGLRERDRIDLLTLTATPETLLDSRRINECFAPSFFETNFWFMWCTTFAFEPWHSAIELRRYLLRFLHLFPTIDTMTGIYRTRYNQYDAIVRPLVKWLKDQGVSFHMRSQVTDLDIRSDEKEITVQRIHYTVDGRQEEVLLTSDDLVFLTNGSMTADSSLGSMTSAPVLKTTRSSGAWSLWETIAPGRPAFGNPSVFSAHPDESTWESFTVTCTDPTFFKRMEEFSGSEAGKGGLITFKDSNWLVTLALSHQPHFIDQPENVFVWWGYGLFPERVGNYVPKKMTACSGKEILEEVLHHLRFEESLPLILATSTCIPCLMPYITSQFLARKKGDRPQVVPKGSTNLAFIGQFSEVPDDVVFTVEYSVRSAQTAVYSLLKLKKKPTAFYKGQHDVKVLLNALKTMHR